MRILILLMLLMSYTVSAALIETDRLECGWKLKHRVCEVWHEKYYVNTDKIQTMREHIYGQEKTSYCEIKVEGIEIVVYVNDKCSKFITD